MFSRRAASEFPNDNPELHDGLVWACASPIGRPLPTLRLRPLVGALQRVLGPSWDRHVESPSEAGAAPAGEATVPATTLEGAFGTFVAALTRVALGRGAVRAAAALGALLEHGRVVPGAFDEATLKTLISQQIVTPLGTSLTLRFRAATDAWRGVLEGTVADLAACGDGTLDVWAADLLCATLNAPRAQAAELRRELRRAGVAAFGLLAVA